MSNPCAFTFQFLLSQAPAEPEDKDNQETQESGPTGQDEEPSAEYKARARDERKRPEKKDELSKEV